MPGAQNFTKSSETPKADEEYMGGQTLGAKIQGREGKSPDRPLRSQSVVWVNKEVFVHWHSGDGLGSSRSMMIAYQRTEGAQRRRKYSGLKTTTETTEDGIQHTKNKYLVSVFVYESILVAERPVFHWRERVIFPGEVGNEHADMSNDSREMNPRRRMRKGSKALVIIFGKNGS